ncbi:hypothetical protein [Ferruginibacter sp.]|nr:hypothetical protein [Ferruginibacter sp.]
MKNKGLIISTIIFFLLVNTTYYWESKLGLVAFPAFLFLVIVFFVLLILLLRQIILAIKEKFSERQRLLIIAILTTVLALAFFKPAGLIDFEKFEGKDILVARREGAANCMTTFKLKENSKFTEKSVCFGMTEIKGDYKLKKDTIFFENVELARGEDEFYKFAVIRPSKFNKDNNHFDLVRYKDLNDTTGHELWITKNDLYKPTDKKPNR